MDSVVDGVKIRYDVLRLPTDVGRRIEDSFYLLTGHLPENLQRDTLFQVADHDEIHSAVSNTVSVAAIVVGNALRRISMIPRMVVLFCIENDTPFLQLFCKKECSIFQAAFTPFVRDDRTA